MEGREKDERRDISPNLIAALVHQASLEALTAPGVLTSLFQAMGLELGKHDRCLLVDAACEVLKLCPALLGDTLEEAILNELTAQCDETRNASPHIPENHPTKSNGSSPRAPLYRLTKALVNLSKKSPPALCRVLSALLSSTLVTNDVLAIAAMRTIMVGYYYSCSKEVATAMERTLARCLFARQVEHEGWHITQLLLLHVGSCGGESGLETSLNMAEELCRRELQHIGTRASPGLRYPDLWAALMWLRKLCTRHFPDSQATERVRRFLLCCVRLHGMRRAQEALHWCAAAAAVLNSFPDAQLTCLQQELSLAFDYPNTAPLASMHPADPWASPKELIFRLRSIGVLGVVLGDGDGSGDETETVNEKRKRPPFPIVTGSSLRRAATQFPGAWGLVCSSLNLLLEKGEECPWMMPLRLKEGRTFLDEKETLFLNRFEIPSEVLVRVFTYLGVKRLCRIMCVSKSWRRGALAEGLWRDFYSSRWPYNRRYPVEEASERWQRRKQRRITLCPREGGIPQSISWHEMYKKRHRAECVARIGTKTTCHVVCPWIGCAAVIRRGLSAHLQSHLHGSSAEDISRASDKRGSIKRAKKWPR